MTDDLSPYRRVTFPPFPDSGLIPGASAEDVMGLVVTPSALLGDLTWPEMAAQACQAEENMWMHGTPTAPEPRGAFGQPVASGGFLIPPGAFGGLIDSVVNARPVLAVEKVVSFVHISPDLLDDTVTINFRPPTPEERAVAEARRAAWKAESDRKHAAAVAEWQQVRERHADSPTVLAVLDIHQPTEDGSLECQECEHADQLVSWPCSTYEAIRDAT